MIISAYLHEGVHKDFKPNLPIRGTEGSVGLDVYSYCISESGRPNSVAIPPSATRPVHTGLVVVPPPGHWLGLYSRSGLSSQINPIMVANAPGVIDPDYRGELIVLLYNGGLQTVWIKHEQRIAQLIVHPLVRNEIKLVSGQASTTERGAGGMGSTGMGKPKE